ncbi:MAG: phenylacetic acid degradation operon negative regulatory protein [Actinomycetota bacterium]|jgi:phenylacetic acid degradation operon negative regulatory protein
MSQVRNTPLLRPLTARSVVASVLLGIDPPRMPPAALVANGELFGVAPGTTRVALSRMIDAGELVVTDDGLYSLAGSLLERHARQEQGRHPKTTRWNGDWRMAVVTGQARPAVERASLRATMAALRMAELREGVWVRPDNMPVMPDARCEWFVARPDESMDARLLFDTDDWADEARDLLRDLSSTARALRDRDAAALAETFVIAAATTRHLTLDPLLPPELLPRDWPGTRLRDAYDDYQRDFAATWRAWYRRTVASTRA